MRLVDSRLDMVSTQWKDSKNIQSTSTVMKSEGEIVQRRNGATVLDVQCPSDIILYQKNTQKSNKRRFSNGSSILYLLKN